MKKRIALCLALVMLLGMLPTALAAEDTMSQQAAQVAAQVKQTLGIGDDYTAFHSEQQQYGQTVNWRMEWSRDDGSSITVSCTDEGKVLEYNKDDGQNTGRDDGYYAPALPKVTDEAFQKAAQDFLNKVLVADETAELDAGGIYRGSERIGCSFDILLKGLPSPLGGSIYADGETGEIVSFWRSDIQEYQGASIPANTPAVAAAEGRDTLYSSDRLQLEYSWEEGQQQATLRYVPYSQDILVVDAQTGQLLNLNQLREQYGTTNESAHQDAGSGSGGSRKDNLTEAELAGLQKLENLLTVDQIEAKLRTMEELGLEGYTRQESSYRYDKEEDLYTCQLSFDNGKQEEEASYLSVQVDAKTGGLLSFYRISFQPEEEAMDAQQAQAKAKQFVETYFPQQAGQVQLYEGASLYDRNSVQLVRQQEGVPFPQNRFTLAFDAQGRLTDFSYIWQDDLAFADTQDVVTPEAALDAWQQARPVELGYAAVPTEDSQMDQLMLVYQFSNDGTRAYGVDAKTGEVLRYGSDQQPAIAYSDVTAADTEILALAQLGIGFTADRFEKTKGVTQADMVLFLLSANGEYYSAEEMDDAYDRAYYLGILERGQRQEDKPVTRAELIKTILDMAGYGRVAWIDGIFLCSFQDAGTIPADYYNYAAIAQGMGMVQGNGAGQLSPNDQATRQQMAIMLYNFMNREVQ